MKKFIYKYSTQKRLGTHTVQGTPRTIGLDGDGHLSVWFEFGDESTEFYILFTGDLLPEGVRIIDTCTIELGLVYHLAVHA